MTVAADLRERITSLLDGALARARRAGLLKPADGDGARVARLISRGEGRPRHAIAEIIQEPAEIGDDISGVTIADPAFINFYTRPELRDAEPRRAETQREAFSRRRIGADREVEVEVLAPDAAGPLTFEGSREAVPADTASPLFRATGYQALAVLTGLGLLSCSMFLLGLAAGYGLGLRPEGSERPAIVHPLRAPVASLAGSSPRSSTGQGSGAAAAKSPRSTSTLAAVASSPAATARVATARRRARRAARAVAAKAGPARFASSDGVRGAPEIAAPVSSSRRKGYSIQIEAVRDQSTADRMVAKLRHLGYQGYMVATPIGAGTWYKVRVGPFANEDEAHWAEAKLREERALNGRMVSDHLSIRADSASRRHVLPAL